MRPARFGRARGRPILLPAFHLESTPARLMERRGSSRSSMDKRGTGLTKAWAGMGERLAAVVREFRTSHAMTRRDVAWLAGCAVAICAIVALDFELKGAVSLDLLYVIPVALSGWYRGRSMGLFVAYETACGRLAPLTIGRAAYLPRHDPTGVPLALLAGWASSSILMLLAAWVAARLREAQEKEHAAARTDSVTGLLNRRAFMERCAIEAERMKRSGGPLSLAFLDLDGFKTVNDALGHEVGDEVLRRVAEVLRNGVRSGDVVCRLGGDEFVILLVDCEMELAHATLARVQRTLLDVMLDNRWPVQASIGIATRPDQPVDIDQMISAADALMYEVKRSGKGQIAAAYR